VKVSLGMVVAGRRRSLAASSFLLATTAATFLSTSRSFVIVSKTRPLMNERPRIPHETLAREKEGLAQ
jgi:hypothetical protein